MNNISSTSYPLPFSSPKREYTKTEAFAEIVAWLYINDRSYPDKNQWRQEFLEKLKSVVDGIKEK